MISKSLFEIIDLLSKLEICLSIRMLETGEQDVKNVTRVKSVQSE